MGETPVRLCWKEAPGRDQGRVIVAVERHPLLVLEEERRARHGGGETAARWFEEWTETNNARERAWTDRTDVRTRSTRLAEKQQTLAFFSFLASIFASSFAAALVVGGWPALGGGGGSCRVTNRNRADSAEATSTFCRGHLTEGKVV